MKCSPDAVELMHKHLDGELSHQEEKELRQHLQTCESCQTHFHELKRALTMITSTPTVKLSADFTSKVMANLPNEKKRVGYKRWFKAHPMLTAAAIFFILMFGSILSAWNQDNQLSVSKQENIVIQDNTVIVPAGKVVEGDLIVKNGDLKIEGAVKGNVVVINGDKYLASAGEVTGNIEEVNQVFEWIWYHIKSTTKQIFNLK